MAGLPGDIADQGASQSRAHAARPWDERVVNVARAHGRWGLRRGSSAVVKCARYDSYEDMSEDLIPLN
jgi:hypothetical protein